MKKYRKEDKKFSCDIDFGKKKHIINFLDIYYGEFRRERSTNKQSS